MGHYYSEMCCPKCQTIPCKCNPALKREEAIKRNKEDLEAFVKFQQRLKKLNLG